LGILGIKLPTLYAWVHRGKLHAHRVGRLLKFDESEVRGMITPPFVRAWAISGPVESAIARARASVGVVLPSYRFFYLDTPKPTRAWVRVQALNAQDLSWVDPAPGGTTYQNFERIKSGEAFLFLGTPDPWAVSEYHPQESGDSAYLAAWIERIDPVPSRDLSEAIRRLEEGTIRGKVEPSTRDELHERGRR